MAEEKQIDSIENFIQAIKKDCTKWENFSWFRGEPASDGLPPFYVPVVMRVFHTHSPCLEEGGA